MEITQRLPVKDKRGCLPADRMTYQWILILNDTIWSDENSFWPFILSPCQLFAEHACSFYSNTLLHIHTIPYIHAGELPSATTDIHCWPLSSFAGALLIHFPLLAASPTAFHSRRISLFPKSSRSHSKPGRRSYIKRRRWLYWADCALRLHTVTVHHGGSSINWKSVFHSGAWLKCGVLCFCDKDSGRWRDMRRACSEEGEERRGPKARHAGSQSNACGGSPAGGGASAAVWKRTKKACVFFFPFRGPARNGALQESSCLVFWESSRESPHGKRWL